MNGSVNCVRNQLLSEFDNENPPNEHRNDNESTYLFEAYPVIDITTDSTFESDSLRNISKKNGFDANVVFSTRGSSCGHCQVSIFFLNFRYFR